jgi:hypothetical protein
VSATDYIINAILVLLVLRQIQENPLDLGSLALPVVLIGAAAADNRNIGGKEESRGTRSPSAGGSLSPGDVPLCPESPRYVQVSCPRSESPGTYMPAIMGELVLRGQR